MTGKKFTAPNRTFSRSRGCYSCTHFNNGELAKNHYKSIKLAESVNQKDIQRLGDDEIVDIQKRVKELRAKGYSDNVATRIAQKESLEMLEAGESLTPKRDTNRWRMFDVMMNSGQIGLCLVNGTKSDFVHHAYLCERWTGRAGAEIAREESTDETARMLPEELKEKVDGSDK